MSTSEQPKSDAPADKLLAKADGGDDREEDLWEGGYSPKAMFGHWLLAGVATLVAVGATAFLAPASGLAWAIVLGGVALVWLSLLLLLAYRRMSISYRLTTQRFLHQSGLLSRTADRIEVIDVDDVNYRQGLVERMVGVGTIRIVSSDRSHPELVLRGIADVRRVSDLIDETRRKERRKRSVHIESV